MSDESEYSDIEVVWVVAFEPLPDSDGSVGGVEWRREESEARAYYDEHVDNHPDDRVQLFNYELPSGPGPWAPSEITAWAYEACLGDIMGDAGDPGIPVLDTHPYAVCDWKHAAMATRGNPAVQATVLNCFATEQEASEFIATLPEEASGRYSLDGPRED